ncbi:hypothetical protein [Desulfofustis glycolicus]|uniref:Uncharacterized protein n=1 Tax=Desulfofustis glycolicus DSM 9705 TaxID=1121409 RepID=A0A1M5XJS2_9BACT|nr:hypothetical protein [Desulfofustis glycolicus]SHI00060.1 hypothetical protein SAMN02745124_03149 [Desulfofustis glycolicus DSM 9705]
MQQHMQMMQGHEANEHNSIMTPQDTSAMSMNDRMAMMERKMAMMENMMGSSGMMGGPSAAAANPRLKQMEKKMMVMQEVMQSMLAQQHQLMQKP